MRKIEVRESGGVKKIFLNNQFVFQAGILDQGFWPDGIYTAPTDEAIKSDVEAIKALGFNMVRKHIKVEPSRWYYWTDKLGLLVWQDMPSANSYLGKAKESAPPVDQAEFELEVRGMIEKLRNVPSIVLWVIFNEGQGQFDTERLVKMVKEMDPSRLVNEASGGKYFGAGDIKDVHHYPAPSSPENNGTQALACCEYGGIGYLVPGHTWTGKGGGYTNVDNGKELVFLYAQFSDLLKSFRDHQGLSASVYTELTDVMTEINGMLTYDRVPKCDFTEIRKATRFEFTQPSYRSVVPTSETQSQPWKYTTETPTGNWAKPGFDDSGWSEGHGGFGKARGCPAGAPWTGKDIWLRKTFNPGDLSAEQISNLVARVYHDDDVQIYINGIPAYVQGGFISAYENHALKQEAKASIRPHADNLLAVHCLQKKGGQFIDVGIFERITTKP